MECTLCPDIKQSDWSELLTMVQVRTHLPQPSPDNVLQKKQARKEKGIWPTSERNWAWLLFTPGFLSIRWNGPVTKYLDPRNVRTPPPRSKYFEIFIKVYRSRYIGQGTELETKADIWFSLHFGCDNFSYDMMLQAAIWKALTVKSSLMSGNDCELPENGSSHASFQC